MGGFREDGAPRWSTTPAGRRYNRLRRQQQRLARRIAGVCTNCGSPRCSGTLCTLCAIDNRERNHKYWCRRREH